MVPFGILIDLSARDSVMEVGFSSPKPSCFYMEYGSRFTLAPKSSSAFSTQVSPILTGIVGHPGSLYFTRVLHSMMALTYSVKKAFLFTLKPLFIVHKSFKNFAYVRTCLIMSRRGMLTLTCRSTSKISVWLTESFLVRSAYGKGGGTLFFTSSPAAGCSSSGGSTTVGVFLVGAGTVGLSSLPLLKVTTALTSSFLHLDHWRSLSHAFPSGFAVSGKGISLFQDPVAS